jgi:carbon-monoxide dehydrogenase small subunit
MAEHRAVHFTVNGAPRTVDVDVRMTLADALRDRLDCTGVHLGCEQGACGACTVLLDGRSVRSCLMLAVQADGAEVVTIEGLPAVDGELHPMQEAFRASHALQCGFCTPGMIMTAVELLRETPQPSEDEIREAISGNLCRCTGYQNIVAAISRAAMGATEQRLP